MDPQTGKFSLATKGDIPHLQGSERAGGGVSALRGFPKGSPSVHLDALRGLAAFSVLLNHWRDAFFADYSTLLHHNFVLAVAYLITGLGHQWVIVFFVMSGYLVGGSVMRAVNSGRWAWRGYLLARLTRLYIVLLPALLLGGVIDWIGIHLTGGSSVYSGHSGMHALAFNVHSTLTLPILLGNALFLQTTVFFAKIGHMVPTFGSNGPLWSLSNEFWYYLAFPPLLLLITKGRSWRMRMLYGACLLAWAWFVGSEIALLGITWLMGVLIPSLPSFPPCRRWARNLAIVLALALFGGGLVLDKILSSLLGDLMLGCVVTLLIWVTLHCATSPLPPTYVRVARRAAHSSYTLYLVHLPLLIFLKASLHISREAPGWHDCLVSVGLMLIILIYAQLVYEIFEKNTDRVRQWLKLHVLTHSTA